jgi:hypothetical protein
MRITLYNDHDSGTQFFYPAPRRSGLYLCASGLSKVVAVKRSEDKIDLVTGKRWPAGEYENTFKLIKIKSYGRPIDQEELGDNHISPGLSDWLQRQYLAGDRYVWIEV